MSERQPDITPAQPSEQYRATINDILSRIFQSPSPELDDRLEVPASVKLRRWTKDEFLFLALCHNTVTSSRADDVTLIRLSPAVDQLYSIRAYQYTRSTGDMSVVDEFYTEEEVAGMEFQFGEPNPRREAIEESLKLGLFAASLVDYLDFLKDLEGASDSTWD